MKFVTVTQASVSKGGQNPDNVSLARPVPPKGSGGVAYTSEGRCHIDVKAGSKVEIIDKALSSDGNVVYKQVTLGQDICVFVENDIFRVVN